MSIFRSGSRSGLAIALSAFGGFSGGLLLGGTTMGGNIDPGGDKMLVGACWIILLGNILMLLFSFVSFGEFSILGTAFCASGWVSTIVGAFTWAFT